MGGVFGGGSTPPPPAPAPVDPPKEPVVNDAVKAVQEMDAKRKRRGRAATMLSTEDTRSVGKNGTWTASKQLLGE